MQILYPSETTTYDESQLAQVATVLEPYIEKLAVVAHDGDYTDPASSINLPTDATLREQVQKLVTKKASNALRYVFVVGIGGSSLGTKAVYEALSVSSIIGETPTLLFVESINAATLQYYQDHIIPSMKSADEYLVLSISKSGGTTETLLNTEILLAALAEKLGAVAARTVVVSDAESAYQEASTKAGMDSLEIPAQVGGRYSVLSAVGLLPLALAGIDIADLQAGALAMRERCLNTTVSENPAALSAACLATAYSDGYGIHDTFVFASELESLGKWYRQLLGESIGKQHTVDGEEVNRGITPTVSVGSTDLHSVGQLYLGGPRDKITSFVSVQRSVAEYTVPEERYFPQVVEMIADKTSKDVEEAILQGVQIAYQKRGLPFMQLQLEELSAHELGQFLQFKMLETMYLGQLLRVNPFDQPNVEMYKTETKRLLQV